MEREICLLVVISRRRYRGIHWGLMATFSTKPVGKGTIPVEEL
jgi:hypothetical protein